MAPKSKMESEEPVDCPPGLECLLKATKLIVEQQFDPLEAKIGCDMENVYKVTDAVGKLMFTAKERSECCVRFCCGSKRSFEMRIFDPHNKEVLRMKRTFKCCGSFLPMFLQSMEIVVPPSSTLLGSFKEVWSFCNYKYRLLDAEGRTVCRIDKSCCFCGYHRDVEFNVGNGDGSQEIAMTAKKYAGPNQSTTNDVDSFTVDFPEDMDIKTKALLLGTCILLDYLHFENDDRNQESKWDKLMSCCCCCRCKY